MAYLRVAVESQTCVIAGYHGTVEPGIVGGSNETFARTLRGPANVDWFVLWIQIEISLGRVGFGGQGCQDDVCYEQSVSRPRRRAAQHRKFAAYSKTKASLELRTSWCPRSSWDVLYLKWPYPSAMYKVPAAMMVSDMGRDVKYLVGWPSSWGFLRVYKEQSYLFEG